MSRRAIFLACLVSGLALASALAPVAGAQSTFSNSNAITIPDSGTASPYPSAINVSGLSAPVTKVTATVHNWNHTCPSDVDVLLVGPQGQKTTLISDSGGGCTPDAVNTTITFDNDAASAYPCDATPSGTFKPTNDACYDDEPDPMPAPAPGPPYPVDLSVFNGTDPNGTWQLYVYDRYAADLGNIANGWSLTITVAPPTTAAPTISGNPVNGQTLTATAGASTGGTSTTFQWLRCDGSGNGCVPILGATGTSYGLTTDDIAHAIRLRQTVTGSAGTATADSAPTSPVAPNPAACSNLFVGTAGNDTLTGTQGGDRIDGLAGSDTLNGLSGADCLDGGTGNDRLSGATGNDRLSGASGADNLSGSGGRDNMSGGTGNDRLAGGTGNDRLVGGIGRDRIAGRQGRNRYSGGPGNDRINSANGRRETVRCGTGRRDRARADLRDRLSSCEIVTRV